MPQPDEVISLDHRLASPQAKDGVMPDPTFNLFYERLLAWVTASEPLTSGKIRRYLKDYIGADGVKDYGTLSKQQNILTQVLARMKEEGLEQGVTYKAISAASVSVSASNMFVQEFMSDVFKPVDDEDAPENMSW